jgi:hypothetical protein
MNDEFKLFASNERYKLGEAKAMRKRAIVI